MDQYNVEELDVDAALKPLPGANHWKDAPGIQDFTRRFERWNRLGYKPAFVIFKTFLRNDALRKRARECAPARVNEFRPELEEEEEEERVHSESESEVEAWPSPEACPECPPTPRFDGYDSSDDDEPGLGQGSLVF
jgi:hypothetical protein